MVLHVFMGNEMNKDHLVIQILSAKNFNYFHAIELRAAYLALHSDKKLSPSPILKLVNRELNKLINKGWLRKSISKRNKITFIKTKLFDYSEINIECKEGSDRNSKYIHSCNKVIKHNLNNLLNEYKNELLIGYGESNEYKRLINEAPNLTEVILQVSTNATENTLRLKGKLKAIENLIHSVGDDRDDI